MFGNASNPKKEICRLCYYETVDTIDLFSEKGKEFDYETKISKYLYLKVCAKLQNAESSQLVYSFICVF